MSPQGRERVAAMESPERSQPESIGRSDSVSSGSGPSAVGSAISWHLEEGVVVATHELQAPVAHGPPPVLNRPR